MPDHVDFLKWPHPTHKNGKKKMVYFQLFSAVLG